jgi:hypothetical protein
MKKTISILAAALLCGCKPSTPPPPAKYETGSMTMYNSDTMATLGYSHYTLNICNKSGNIETNVATLDRAANILGQYGWEFVSSSIDRMGETYHLKRQAQADGYYFYLSTEH